MNNGAPQPRIRGGGISLIYAALAEPLGKASYMLNWERDLDIELDLDTWHSHFASAYKGMLNISLIEANLKVISRWYLVPACLAKYYSQSSPLYDHLGTILHIWWQCPRIISYWNKIFRLIHKITGTAVIQDPTIAFLNHRIPKISKSTQSLIHFIFL